MNKFLIVTLLLFNSWFVRSQTPSIDSIINVLKSTKDDRVKVLGIAELSRQMAWYNPDSAYTLALKGIMLSRQIDFYEGEMYCKVSASACSWSLANYALAIELLLPIIPDAIKTKDIKLKTEVFANLHNAYRDQGDYVEALKYFKIAEQNIPFIDNCTRCKLGKAMLAFLYLKMGRKDSMDYYIRAALQYPASSFPLSEGWIYSVAGLIYTNRMQYDAAFFYYQHSIHALIQENNQKDLACTYNNISSLFTLTRKPDSALVYLNKSIAISKEKKFAKEAMESNLLLAQVYESIKSDSALYYFKKAIIARDSLYTQEKQKQILGYKFKQDLDLLEVEAEKKQNENRIRQYLLVGLVIFFLAVTFLLIRNNRHKQKANALLQSKNRDLEIEAALDKVRSRSLAMHHSDELSSVVNTLFKQLGSLKLPVTSTWVSLVKAQEEAMEIWTTHGDKFAEPIKVKASDHDNFKQEIEAWKNNLALINIPTPKDSAIRDIKKFFNIDLKDEKDATAFHILNVRHQQGYIGMGSWQPADEKEINILRRFAAVFEQTYTRFLDLQKAEKQVEQAKLDFIQIQTEKKRAEDALTELKITQAQLIQSEKLASLGELTAGIAHEIQNPLNFVNNFAEVSAEMLDEMHEELEKGDTTEAIAIATDLKTNLEKINHHGQRASSIVKGMLEHSRASTGVKEPTDLNALIDEYLRLAFHGLRAKDNNFNATLETHFDPDLPLVSVIPQDIGRVFLNLINNAFYAVGERSRSTVGAPLAGAQPYVPTVTVSSKKLGNAIEIRVKDNGPGIPESIRDKIFQPFFTTKPTGQGTGLGLSLAYDIVTKGHGGTINCQSNDLEGTTFSISLPIPV